MAENRNVRGNHIEPRSVHTPEARVLSDGTVLVNVPTDYPTVGSALSAISELVPNGLFDIHVNIESGHEWQDEVEISHSDLRHVILTSDDDTVSFSDDFPAGGVAFSAEWSYAPEWDITLDGTGSDVSRAIRVRFLSSIEIGTGSGAQNVDRGVQVSQGSALHGFQMTITDCNERNIAVSNSSLARVQNSILTGAGTLGIRCGNSIVDADDADVSGSETGVLASNSGLVDMSGGVADNCQTAINAKSGAEVSAPGLSATGCSQGLDAEDGGEISAPNADLSDAENNAVRCFGATVNVRSGTISDPLGRGLFARRGGEIIAHNVTVTNAVDRGIDALDGSKIVATDSTVTGSGDIDARCLWGSKVVLNGTETTQSTGGDPHELDATHTGFDTVDGIVLGDFEQ